MTDTLHIFFKPNKQSWLKDLLSETVHHKFFLMILIFLIPQIGQFLLTLPQHPEPFNMQDNPSVTPLRTPHDTFEILWKFNIILMQLFLHCKKLLVFKKCFTFVSIWKCASTSTIMCFGQGNVEGKMVCGKKASCHRIIQSTEQSIPRYREVKFIQIKES